MIYKKCFYCLSLLFLFLFFGRAEAILAPQIYLDDLKTNQNVYQPGATIDGTISVQNYENFYMGDLLLQFQLLAKEVDGVPTQVIDQQTTTNKFELAAGAKIVKSFSYILPANLPNGNLVFRVQLVNGRGEEINWDDKIINIGGNGSFLILDNAWIIKDNKQMAAGGGVYYNPGETVNVRFDINNNSGFTISAFPRIVTYLRNPGMKIADNTDQTISVFTPGSHQTMNYTLPKLTKPETYLTEIKLYDSQTKLPVSNSIFFRWIISGEGAEILFTQTDKNLYKTGETAHVAIQYNGPADYNLTGGKGVIETAILDNNGTIVGQTSQEITLESGQVTMDIPIQKDVNGFKVVSSITENSNKLDQYEMPIKSDSSQTVFQKEQPVSQKSSPFKNLWGNIIGAILLIVAIGIIIYFVKRK